MSMSPRHLIGTILRFKRGYRTVLPDTELLKKSWRIRGVCLNLVEPLSLKNNKASTVDYDTAQNRRPRKIRW